MKRLRAVATVTMVTMFGLGTGISASAAQASALQWQQQVTPALLGGLAGVSCPSPDSCVAVGTQQRTSGQYAYQALAEAWDGSSWAVEATPFPSGTTSGLASVSCISSSWCVAVGTTGNLPVPLAKVHTFSEVLRGGKWEIVATAKLPIGTVASLSSVSCWETGSCVAVGGYTSPTGSSGTLAEVFDGSSWSIDKTPAIAGGSLSGVSCLPATVPALCTAVGSKGAGAHLGPLVEHANGNDWQTVGGPAGVPSGTQLSSVSCPQPTSCVAVGGTFGTKAGVFAEVDNLNKWTTVQMPKLSTPYAGLSGVSCPVTIDLCEAVGHYYGGSSDSATLAESWDGHSWAVQASPAVRTGPELDGVSCSVPTTPSGADCTVAGIAVRAAGGQNPVALRYSASGAGTSSGPSSAGAAQLLAYGHGSSQTVYVVPSTGGSPRALPVVNTEQYPSWSPDGKEIAFTDTLGCEECSEIDIATENGESSFQLTTSGVNGDPSWSPTGALIAYAHSSSVTATTGYIYVVSPEGNGPRPLVGSLPGGGIVDGPAVWSPNGSELALTALGGGSNGTTGQGIYLIGADGKGLHRLTTGNDQGPVWSPNGKVIAFSRVTPLPLKTSRSDVYLIGSNGQGLHRLVSGAMQSNSPSWSPSGSQIAFAGSPPKEGWTALYVTGATGGALRRLTPYQVVINPSWSPNGAVIAFTSPHGGPLSLSNNWDVDVVPPNGGAERDLSGTDYAFSDTYLVWQP